MYTFKYKKSGLWTAIAGMAMALGAVSCIENDLPYPRIQPNFTAFEVAGQIRSAAIDSASRSVTVYIGENVDIQNVDVTRWAITPGASFPDSAKLESPLDLTSPVDFTLSIYQDYVWTVTAIQNIERYFTVASQIGASVIDVEHHTVTATVPTQQPLDDITVRSIKLAGSEAVMEPDLAGKHVDFTEPVQVTVTEFGRSTVWTVTVEQSDVNVDLTSVDAWTCVAWLHGEGEAGKNNGFEYRLSTSDTWTVVPAEWITHDGGSFTGRLINLLPMTEYVARAVSGEEHSVERTFTTGSIIQLPNNEFTQWWLDDKVWCPWARDGEAFWGTGNKGATTLGQSNTVPINDADSPTGYSGASLQSKFVGIGMLGKLAAGNLFAGSYVRTDGTNGILSFGREFTQRPTRVRGHIEYTTAPISHTSSSNPDFRYMKGEPDTCIIWCALGDWDEPYEIRTKPSERHLFDRNDAGVVAYGQVQYGYSTEGYVEFVIDMEYVSTSRAPKWILLTASASKYGDYFTGANGAVLNIKDYVLEYDY
ncbi:MAG: PCMD domain-containing protein [Muribaculaceae bacterium]|nr:PCMD domain-containing protein [Muribaculaceae bacterium]